MLINNLVLLLRHCHPLSAGHLLARRDTDLGRISPFSLQECSCTCSFSLIYLRIDVVLLLQVIDEGLFVLECFVAIVALEGAFPGVDPHVDDQVTLLWGRVLALKTLVNFLTLVCLLVLHEAVPVREAVLADFADERLSLGVHLTDVGFHVCMTPECGFAVLTPVSRAGTSMLPQMLLQATLLGETLLTLPALERLLTSMNSHVTLQLVVVCAGIVAQGTSVRLLTCMGPHVTFDLAGLYTVILTERTLVWFFMGVDVLHVSTKLSRGFKGLVTYLTLVWLGTCMCVEVITEKCRGAEDSAALVALMDLRLTRAGRRLLGTPKDLINESPIVKLRNHVLLPFLGRVLFIYVWFGDRFIVVVSSS